MVNQQQALRILKLLNTVIKTCLYNYFANINLVLQNEGINFCELNNKTTNTNANYNNKQNLKKVSKDKLIDDI